MLRTSHPGLDKIRAWKCLGSNARTSNGPNVGSEFQSRERVLESGIELGRTLGLRFGGQYQNIIPRWLADWLVVRKLGEPSGKGSERYGVKRNVPRKN